MARLSTTVPLHPAVNDHNMPCMYTPHSHLPLTPPEYMPQYSGCGIQISQHQYAVGTQGLPVPEKGVYEINVDPYGRKLMPSFVRVTQGYQQSQQQQPPTNYTGLPPPGITHPATQYYHQSQRRVEAPIGDENYHRLARQPEVRRAVEQQPAAPVEEKPTGGVAAHLDYNMDEMTDFVGTMAQRLVVGQAASERLLPSYRKFVYQVLSSTRLPSSTILLGLVYLRERTTMPQMAGTRQEHVYRLLTIALLLASKFLDDNTFQNKSWSEVTNIPVQELNQLEKDWLREIKWNLHVDPEGTKGFSQYKTMWDVWVERNLVKIVPSLAPIDTNFRPRSHSAFSPVPLYPPHQQHYTPPHSGIVTDRSVQLPPVRPSQQTDGFYGGWNPDYSPLSAPETGPTTPEGFGWSYGNSTQHSAQGTAQPTGYSRLPPIVTFHHQGWHAHHPHAACNCPQCRHHTEGYFMSANYGQPIAA